MDATFTFDEKKLNNFIKTKANNLIRTTVIDVHNEIVYRTPVDTGNARVSWDYEFSTDKDGYLQGHIRNYVEYIVHLEYGSSAQAPKGMVTISLQNIAERLK